MEPKNGLLEEDGKRIFYKDGQPYHAGVVKWDGRIYYIGKGGKAVTGEHIVHREMGNGILERGTYTFGEDGVLIEGSFRAPQKSSRKRKRKRSSKSRSRKKLSKKNRRRLIGVLAAAAVLIAAVTAAALWDQRSAPTVDEEPSEVAVILPVFDEEVRLCADEAYAYFNGELSLGAATASGDPYRAMTFEFDLRGQSGELFIGEREDLSDAAVWAIPANAGTVTVDNLKTGTAYYYRVAVNGETYDGSFTTEEGHRFLSVPGAYNMRDIGGYTVSDGRRIRQGMILRGTEIDGLVRTDYCPSQKAVASMTEQFGLVFDFDLREPNVGGSAFRSRLGVPHRFYSAPMYGNVFNDAFRESVRAMFADLADETHYPMYMHCTHGVDRTGTLVYLLMGVLGASEEQMMQEYRLSAFFAEGYEDNTLIEGLYDGLQAYPGTTINEKIEVFLTTDIGVTEAELESIRRILLETP